ncbi:4-hydroxybenzoate octaprenyltransferase [Oleispirillum naphthae]|uniref:4-hydroxybenzoate octaprenyltransferase n=1 Tax=Oleispirillum naphthae TaxID=2838853 RepID=UPI0030826818
MTTAKPIVNDMPVGGWTDRCPAPLRPYLKLLRLDRPIGTWLLLLPCWWSAALAAPSPWDGRVWGCGILFGIGALLMRGAGCVVNDLADRDFDGKVERTATRPIPAGQVSVKAALVFLACVMLAGFAVLVQFNRHTILLGVASIPVFAVYPFMKRVTYWPQFWLGLAFNWGALAGWSAITGGLAAPALLLYAGGICWTLGYDTIYAHQDKADDVKIGVLSTALALGSRTRLFLTAIYPLALACIAAAFLAAQTGPWAWPFLGAAGGHLAWQVITLDIDDPPNCLKRFKSNRDFGLLVTLAALAAHV